MRDAEGGRGAGPEPGRGAGGFALLAVLWVTVGLGALSLAGLVAAREAVAAARNRGNLTVALWRAEDCLARLRAAVAEALGTGAGGPSSDRAWTFLDHAAGRWLPAPGEESGACQAVLVPVGSRLDVNAADHAALRRLLAFAGTPAARADSLAAALLDWRDADDTPREGGAERDWYVERGLRPPRNGLLADIRELTRVRGFDAIPGAEGLLATERGRVCVNHAPPAVLASLPGFTAEAVELVSRLQRQGEPVSVLLEIGGGLSGAARERLLREYAELSAVATTEPDAWIATARGRAGSPRVTVAVEVRLERSGDRAAVVRRRSWVE